MAMDASPAVIPVIVGPIAGTKPGSENHDHVPSSFCSQLSPSPIMNHAQISTLLLQSDINLAIAVNTLTVIERFNNISLS